MGQKVNPIGVRTGVMIGWKSRWYASKQDFSELLLEDFKIRNFIKKHPKKSQYRQAGIDKIEVLSVAPLIAEALGAVFDDTSVSDIFDGENLA